MTARKLDQNGFVTIDRNPISRSGIFQYLGRSIDRNAEPDRVYNVWRPESELADPACLDSFKLIPIVDDHTMLGDGYTPAEKKGVHGSTGEDVIFENKVLRSNLRIFSQTVKKLIDSGKKHLSCGYRCRYEKTPGMIDGKAYDYIQRDLRGNHLALVDQSRCDVLVLDSNIAFDYADINLELKNVQTSSEELPMTITKEDIKAAIDEAIKPLNAKIAAMDEEKKNEKEAEEKKAADEAAEKTKAEKEAADKKAKDEEGKEKKEEKEKGMDAAEIAELKSKVSTLEKNNFKTFAQEVTARDALAKKISAFVGTFDAADKTLDEVAKYGVDKLELKCAEGQELAALDGYFHNRPNPSKQPVVGLDGKKADGKDPVDTFLDANK